MPAFFAFPAKRSRPARVLISVRPDLPAPTDAIAMKNTFPWIVVLLLATAQAFAEPLLVRNPSSPANGVIDLTLQEIWRVGGAEDDPVFGVIAQVLADDEGRIHVLDRQLSCVHVLAPDGAYLRQLSREGDGPGETRNPGALLFLSDGRIGIVQAFPGRIVTLERDGTPAGVLDIAKDPAAGGYLILAFARHRGGNLVFGGIDVVERDGVDQRLQFVGGFSTDGHERVRYAKRPRRFTAGRMMLDEAEDYFLDADHFGVGPEGRVYAATERDRYAITVHAPDGGVERAIERAFESRVRDDAEAAELQARFDYHAAQYRNGAETRVCDTEPDIHSLHVDGDGRLWVRHSRSDHRQAAGVVMALDVFDGEGRFDRIARIRGPGDADADGWFFLEDGRVIRVAGLRAARLAMQAPDLVDEGADAAALEIICYEPVAG